MMIVSPGRFGGGAGGGGSDPYWPTVVLDLDFEGTDASTTVTDYSPAAHGNATAVGNAQISTAQKKFGTSSGLFDGSGDGFTFADSPDWRLSAANSDPFAIRAFIRPHAASSGTIICQDDASGSNFSWALEFTPARCIFFEWSANGSWFAGNRKSTGATTTQLTLDVWHYILVTKDAAGKIRVHVNGVMEASVTPADSSFFNSTATLTIGKSAAGGDFNGRMDALQINKGSNLGTTDANVTVPTAPYPRS